MKYEPVIRAALEKADWLIVVFTGYQSVYCGYEIGMYSIIKSSTHEKPVACLHDIERSKLPGVVDGYNTTLISRVALYLHDPPNELTTDAQLWWNSPVGMLLRGICASKGLYTPQHRSTSPVQYQIDIAQAASKIAYAFELARQEDEVSETPVQAALELTVVPPFPSNDQRIPTQSVLLGSSRAFEILGLSVPHSLDANEAPHLTWGELRQAVSQPGHANIPWMDRLETNIFLAAALRSPQPDDVTFRSSGQDHRIYRAVLTRHKLYKNGKRRFYVLLVETFDRRFVGDPETSLILTALMLASRWRFTFFERWQDTLNQFDAHRSDSEFVDACKQLEYNMEWIENEGVELGLADVNMMVQAFGAEHKARVERFYEEFYSAKDEMKNRLPPTFEKLTPETRSAVQAAIIKFLTIVKDENTQFLKLCVRVYAHKIGAETDDERR